MNPKNALTGALLVFVVGSLVWLTAREMRSRPAEAETSQTVQPPAEGAGASAEKGTTPAVAVTPEVIVYYFHGDVRCVTCRAIEAYAREAIEQGFAADLASGRLQWRLVNVDQAGNEHFVEDFNLITRSLVLARMQDGRTGEFLELEKVWGLVGDKPAFLEYVRNNTRAMLKKPS